MDDDHDLSLLIGLLRGRLSAEELDLLRAAPPTAEADYDRVLERVQRQLPRLEQEVLRNAERVRERYEDLIDQPEGRQAVVLHNSPPPMLAALAHSLIRQSFASRFSDLDRCLSLSSLAADAARLLAETDYVSSEFRADLLAHALAHLANARRLHSDLLGAETILAEAERWRGEGTGDRELQATLLNFLGVIRFDQGRATEAAALLDKEIALRRLVGNREALGVALISRGVIAAWSEEIDPACDFLEEGAKLVEESPELMLLALLALGEFLAREGRGFEAWKVVCRADTAIVLLGDVAERFVQSYRWLRGNAYRAVGELESAEKDLLSVRAEFLSRGLSYPAAILSLDLAGVYAAQGRNAEVKRLAEEALAIFTAEGGGENARAAFVAFYEAAQAERVTVNLAVRVSNFLVRSQYNRELSFEGPG